VHIEQLKLVDSEATQLLTDYKPNQASLEKLGYLAVILPFFLCDGSHPHCIWAVYSSRIGIESLIIICACAFFRGRMRAKADISAVLLQESNSELECIFT
jgi:hypothetical protein